MTTPSSEHTGAAHLPAESSGKLYRLGGKKARAGGAGAAQNAARRVPITEEAFQAALKIRAQVQKRIRMRPDLSIVISAMLEHVADTPELVDAVAQYGLRVSAEAVVSAEAARQAPAQPPATAATA
jgi:hypothetical protein